MAKLPGRARKARKIKGLRVFRAFVINRSRRTGGLATGVRGQTH
jgi:hypothetical protein